MTAKEFLVKGKYPYMLISDTPKHRNVIHIKLEDLINAMEDYALFKNKDTEIVTIVYENKDAQVNSGGL